MLDFVEFRRKPEEPGEKPSEQGKNQCSTNTTHIWCHLRGSKETLLAGYPPVEIKGQIQKLSVVSMAKVYNRLYQFSAALKFSYIF